MKFDGSISGVPQKNPPLYYYNLVASVETCLGLKL